MEPLRRCLKTPIAEFALAADLLDQAADALLAGYRLRCAELLKNADLLALRRFAYEVAGPIRFEVHRQESLPIFTPVPKANRLRMPSAAKQLEVMRRDGFRCRFCGSRVLVKEAHRIFAREFPEEARLGGTNETKHYGLATLTASIDHLIPYARNGDNSERNLVTACGPCQFGRGHWTLEEVEVVDPWNYPPIVDGWDGLSRLRQL